MNYADGGSPSTPDEQSLTKIFQSVIFIQAEHMKYLNSTRRNAAYYFFGRWLDFQQPSVYPLTVYPQFNLLDAVANFNPEPSNPLQAIVSSFVEEIATTELTTTVSAFPSQKREPYESYCDTLEDYLNGIHRACGRQKTLRNMLYELLFNGYFGIYCNGRTYFYLTAYDLIPGDRTVLDAQSQPLWIRRTLTNKATLRKNGIDVEKLQTAFLKNATNINELDKFYLYDVWIKDMDLNVVFTDGGSILYTQPFPEPKRYPFFIGNTSEVHQSFYPVPLMNMLVQLMIEYKEAFDSVKFSATSIAKPLLLVDMDAGVDIDMLHSHLKKGDQNIIVGKNREGNVSYAAPGQLPAYAQTMPQELEGRILAHLGLNASFMGSASSNPRERGAMSRLIKMSFRKLTYIASILEDVYSGVDQYLLDYLAAHKLIYTPDAVDTADIFNKPVRYIANEKFKAFSTDDSTESKMMVLNKLRSGLLSKEQALRELGESQPRRILQELQEEQRADNDFKTEMMMAQQTVAPKSLFDKVSERLNGQLQFRFWLAPAAEDKVILRIAPADKAKTNFLLADMQGKVFMEIIDVEMPAPVEQQTYLVRQPALTEQGVGNAEAVPGAQPQMQGALPQTQSTMGQAVTPQSVTPMQGVAPVLPTRVAGPEIQNQERRTQSPPNRFEGGMVPEETRGRPLEKTESKMNPEQDMMDKNEGKQPYKPAPMQQQPKFATFNPAAITKYSTESHIIQDPSVYNGAPGIYMVEPHAKWIAEGKKTALVLNFEANELMDKEILLVGAQIYGIIILRQMVQDFDFNETRQYHMISDREKVRFFGNKPLYLYLFEYHPFPNPIDYEKQSGQKTLMSSVKFGPTESASRPEGFRETPQTVGTLAPAMLDRSQYPQANTSKL